MTVRIRLSRIGKKKVPFYKIVAVDKRAKRDGQCLENLGTYNALTGEIIQFHADKIQAWIEKGALPSDTVIRIQKKHARGDIGPKPKITANPKKKAAPAKEKVADAVEAKKVKPVKAPDKAPEASVKEAALAETAASTTPSAPKKEEKKVEAKKEASAQKEEVKKAQEKTEDTADKKE